jgi:hypothetical protein
LLFAFFLALVLHFFGLALLQDRSKPLKIQKNALTVRISQQDRLILGSDGNTNAKDETADQKRSGHGVNSPPLLISEPDFESLFEIYPNIEEKIIATLLVSRTGNAERIAISSKSALPDNLISSLKTLLADQKYSPATKDGRSVRSELTIVIEVGDTINGN